MVVWLITQNGFPSMTHSRYLSKGDCQVELDRLLECDRKHNERVKLRPATGRGRAFLNMECRNNWGMKELEVPK